MPTLLRSRPFQITAAFVAVAMGLIGLLPLFGGPGYESALAAGLLMPGAAAIGAALDTSTRRDAPFEALARGAAIGAALALVAFLTTLLHGLRVGFCDAAGGVALFALGPGSGAVMGGAWGAVAGEIAGRLRRRRLAAALLGLSGPLGAALVSVGRFYMSPIIFAYDPFVGFFSGSLYDTIVDPSGLFTYRAGSAATLLAASVAALHLGRDGAGRLGLRSPGRPWLLALGLAAAIASGASMAFGDRLGHWQTAGTIARALGARVEGERCEVVYPRGVPLEEIMRFTRDCDAHVAAGERWLGAPALRDGQPLRVRAYLFESVEQKGALMGAARTYIAKPWRREVYLQVSDYPHGALGHELMHVLSGAFARGPFKIAGALGGVIPDPGLIEGIAVAGSPKDSDLTPREWAKAMKDLGILPPLKRLFAFGFLAENSATAYTVTGAFVGHTREKYGADVLRAWYGGRALPDLTGASWEALERAWHAELDTIALPEAAALQAKARFDRPAIFGRRCPRVVDRCRADADRLRARGDAEGALAELGRIQQLDASPATRVAAAVVRLDGPDREAGARELEAIAADASIPRHVRDRALEELADARLADGDGPRAVALYKEIVSRLVDEDRLRTLDVKIASAGEERARAAVVELLIGSRPPGPDQVRAAELLGAWAALAPEDGLPSYLLARRSFGDGRFEDAAARLDRALAGEIPIARVRAEAARLRLVVACGLGDPRTAERMFRLYAAGGVSAARLDAARSLLLRCGGAEAGEGAAPP